MTRLRSCSSFRTRTMRDSFPLVAPFSTAVLQCEQPINWQPDAQVRLQWDQWIRGLQSLDPKLLLMQGRFGQREKEGRLTGVSEGSATFVTTQFPCGTCERNCREEIGTSRLVRDPIEHRAGKCSKSGGNTELVRSRHELGQGLTRTAKRSPLLHLEAGVRTVRILGHASDRGEPATYVAQFIQHRWRKTVCVCLNDFLEGCIGTPAGFRKPKPATRFS